MPTLKNYLEKYASSWLGLLLVQALLGLPLTPLAPWLQSSMLGHMAQLLLLVVWPAAWVLSRALAWPANHAVQRCAHAYRWSGMVLVLGISMLWMLPRMLDLAQTEPWLNVFKSLSLGLVGLCFPLVWPHLSLPVRGVIHLEALATLWRMAWLYWASPVRLCNQYGQSDQLRLGQALWVAGALYALFLLLRVCGWQPRWPLQRVAPPKPERACNSFSKP